MQDSSNQKVQIRSIRLAITATIVDRVDLSAVRHRSLTSPLRRSSSVTQWSGHPVERIGTISQRGQRTCKLARLFRCQVGGHHDLTAGNDNRALNPQRHPADRDTVPVLNPGQKHPDTPGYHRVAAEHPVMKNLIPFADPGGADWC